MTLHSVVVLYSVYHPTGDKSTLSPALAPNPGVPRRHSNGAGRTPPLHPLLTRKPSILLLPQTLKCSLQLFGLFSSALKGRMNSPQLLVSHPHDSSSLQKTPIRSCYNSDGDALYPVCTTWRQHRKKEKEHTDQGTIIRHPLFRTKPPKPRPASHDFHVLRVPNAISSQNKHTSPWLGLPVPRQKMCGRAKRLDYASTICRGVRCLPALDIAVI